LSHITINFIGQWRLSLGERDVSVEAESLKEIRDYIEDRFGPGFQGKLRSQGIRENISIWENSNILLNGKNINKLNSPVLKDGDVIELLPRMAGG